MDNYQYAGFWVRFGAVIIDMIILFIVIILPLSLIHSMEHRPINEPIFGILDSLLNYIFPLFATIWFWQKFLGTPGKMALKIKIVDARTGNKLTVAQSIGRYFAYILSALPLCLGFIWIGIDNKKQGWHDKLAGSVVIRDTAATPVKFENGA